MAEVSFRVFVGNKQVDDVVRAFKSKTAITRTRLGCLSCTVEVDAENPGGIRFSSTWETEGHMKVFLVSDIVTKILQIIELSEEEPEIHINSHVAQDGLKTLTAIRSGVEGSRGILR